MPKWLLELPWGVRFPGVKYDSTLKVAYVEAEKLSPFLAPFKVLPFSYGEWVQEELNGKTARHEPGPVKFTPRPHQAVGAKKIAAMRRRGWSGFLLADHTGTGKTLTALAGVTLAAKESGFSPQRKAKLLVVAPKGVMPVWRQTLGAYPGSLNYVKPLIINYQQLQKLLVVEKPKTPPKRKTRKSKQIATAGKPLIDFDFVVFDESQYLKNYPSSNVSLMAEKVAGLDKVYKAGASPFVVFSSATPGSTPLNFAIMAGVLGKLLKPQLSRPLKPSEWGEFLMSNGFDVRKGKNGYLWATLPWSAKESSPAEKKAVEKEIAKVKAIQRRDTKRIGDALTSAGAPFIVRTPKDIAGWPEQQLIALPVALDAQQRQWYDEAWSQFRNWLRLTPAKSDPKGQLVETLRYRQKTSLLRVPALAELANEWIDEHKQVYFSFEFIETIDAMKEELLKRNIRVVELSGRNSEQREQERLKFQRGQASVALCTVVAGISLHAGEILPDGTQGSTNERVTVLADIRQNPLDSLQALGRAHRDGQNSLAYIPYIEDSVDDRVVNSFVNKVINTKVLTGEKLEEALELERIFRESAAENQDE